MTQEVNEAEARKSLASDVRQPQLWSWTIQLFPTKWYWGFGFLPCASSNPWVGTRGLVGGEEWIAAGRQHHLDWWMSHSQSLPIQLCLGLSVGKAQWQAKPPSFSAPPPSLKWVWLLGAPFLEGGLPQWALSKH